MEQITRGGQIVETITFPINKTSDDFKKLIQPENGELFSTLLNRPAFSKPP
jgi:hypothetical protein